MAYDISRDSNAHLPTARARILRAKLYTSLLACDRQGIFYNDALSQAPDPN